MAANYMAQFSVNSGTGCCQHSDKNRCYLFGCMFVWERGAVCRGYAVVFFVVPSFASENVQHIEHLRYVPNGKLHWASGLMSAVSKNNENTDLKVLIGLRFYGQKTPKGNSCLVGKFLCKWESCLKD